MTEKEQQKTAHILTLIIIGILGFSMVIFAFGFGVWVGQERAEFSFRWAEEYGRNFGGPQKGIFGDSPAGGFMNNHGIFGQIIKIDADDVIMKGQDNVERTIVVSDKTTIVKQSAKITLSDLQVNDSIVVIGSPDNQGQVDAEFIRVLPAPVSFLINTINNI